MKKIKRTHKERKKKKIEAQKSVNFKITMGIKSGKNFLNFYTFHLDLEGNYSSQYCF
jgi:hypothetical protein